MTRGELEENIPDRGSKVQRSDGRSLGNGRECGTTVAYRGCVCLEESTGRGDQRSRVKERVPDNMVIKS